MTKKSDEADRRAVIVELGRRLNIRLKPIGNRRKYLRDVSSDRRFCIVVGEQLHGLPHAVVDDSISSEVDITLIVAMKLPNRISIFSVPLRHLLPHLSALSSSKDHYIFTVSRKGDGLGIDQIRSVSLEYLCEIAYGATEHQRMQNLRAVEKKVEAMTPEEKAQFLSTLKVGI